MVIPVQHDAVSNMHCSSSFSDAESPPAKKERKLWNAGTPVQPKHKLQILSSRRLQPWGDKDEISCPRAYKREEQGRSQGEKKKEKKLGKQKEEH